MVVVCTLVILLSNGYRLVEQIEGIEIKEVKGDALYVDFSKELKKRKYKLDKSFALVQVVKENSCIYK